MNNGLGTFLKSRSRYVVMTSIIVTVPVFPDWPNGPTRRIARRIAKQADGVRYAIDSRGMTRRATPKTTSKRAMWRYNVAKFGVGAWFTTCADAVGRHLPKHRDFAVYKP